MCQMCPIWPNPLPNYVPTGTSRRPLPSPSPPLSPPPEACYPAAIVNHRVTREQHREKTRHDLRRCWKLREGKE